MCVARVGNFTSSTD